MLHTSNCQTLKHSRTIKPLVIVWLYHYSIVLFTLPYSSMFVNFQHKPVPELHFFYSAQHTIHLFSVSYVMHINICEKYYFNQVTSPNNCTINKTFLNHNLIMQTNFLQQIFFFMCYWDNCHEHCIISYFSSTFHRFAQAFPCAFVHLNHTLSG